MASVTWGVTTWQEEHPFFDEDEMRYMETVQHECPTTKKKHWHSYIQFFKLYRIKAVKKLIDDNEAHLKKLYSGDTSYLEDGHDTIAGPFSFGKKCRQGKRRDLDAFKEALDSDMPIKDISDQFFPQWLKYQGLVAKYRSLHAPLYKSKYKKEDYFISIHDWDKHYHLWGPPDTGKTQFALAQFESPLYIRHPDHLTNFDQRTHDGIVIDELSFTHWPTTAVICLLNKKDPAHVHVRYTVADLPAGVRIIFCSNEEKIFYGPTASQEAVDSIDAKLYILHIDKKLWEVQAGDEL